MLERIAEKLLIVGWDAADWKMLEPLLARGQMPHFQRLLDRGTRADLGTLEPKLSPLLWTSIATGKTADEHGILNFVEPDAERGGLRLASSTSRKCKALWNMLTQAGMHVNVISWYASHPAEPIRGTCVSNLFLEGVPENPGDPWPMNPAAVHPESAVATVAAGRVHPLSVDKAALKQLVPSLARSARTDRRIGTLRRLLSQCESVNNAACSILKSDPNWNCTMVFFDTIDAMGHHFMEYHPPRMAHVTKEDFRIYKDVMVGIYRHMDRLLGELLQHAGENVTAMLLSDHGFHSDSKRPVMKNLSGIDRDEVEAAWHRNPGVLVMSGRGLAQGSMILSPTLLDITPTALALMGCPTGADMPGRVLTEAFASPGATPTAIPSWDAAEGQAGMHPTHLRMTAFEAHDAIRQLIDLGYLADLPEDSLAQLDLVRRETNFNHGIVLMSRNRFAEAIVLFRALVEQHPHNHRYVIPLCRCLIATLQFDECVEVLNRFLTNVTGHPEAQVMRAGALSALGRRVDALADLQSVERTYPDRGDLSIGVGEVYASIDRCDDAQRHFAKALRDDASAPAAHLGMARVELARRNFEAAGEHALDALEHQPHAADAHHLLGIILVWLGDLDHAVQSFNLALQLQPGMIDAHRFLAIVHHVTGAAEPQRVHVEFIRNALKSVPPLAVSYARQSQHVLTNPAAWAAHKGLNPDQVDPFLAGCQSDAVAPVKP